LDSLHQKGLAAYLINVSRDGTAPRNRGAGYLHLSLSAGGSALSNLSCHISGTYGKLLIHSGSAVRAKNPDFWPSTVAWGGTLEIRAVFYSEKPLSLLRLRPFSCWRRMEFASRSGCECNTLRTRALARSVERSRSGSCGRGRAALAWLPSWPFAGVLSRCICFTSW
jgi:hypothetical protein